MAEGGERSSATIRRAQLADCRGIAEVHVRTWQIAYRHAFPVKVLDSLSVDDREALCRRLVESGSEVVWVAEAGNGVIGFASAGPSRTENHAAELYAIYVLPESWGSEAARELLAAARAWFAREGYATAMLWVLAENLRARRFYEREGWRADGTRVDRVRGIEIEEALYRLAVQR
jgi:GNAT superfamily N-acetyltransferase